MRKSSDHRVGCTKRITGQYKKTLPVVLWYSHHITDDVKRNSRCDFVDKVTAFALEGASNHLTGDVAHLGFESSYGPQDEPIVNHCSKFAVMGRVGKGERPSAARVAAMFLWPQ